MTLANIYRILKFDYLMLFLIMALAFYITFIPRQDYPYPLHLDEWTHLACSNQIIEEESATRITDPFSGEGLILNQLLEVGFHLFWAVVHQISGIPWLTIFRYFPGIIFIIIVLSVYVLAQRQGYGWEAAFFTCLIPTTVGILGPAFMVPVAMGLLFIPLFLCIAFNYRSWWSYLLLFIFMAFLVFLHPPTAVVLIIILAPYILINVKGDFKHSLGVTLAIVTPFLLSIPVLSTYPWMLDTLLPAAAKSLFTEQPLKPWVDYLQVIPTYGYLPVLFCLLGTFLLTRRGGKRNYGLVLGLLALLVMLVTFFTFHYGVSIVVERGPIYAMLMMSIIAGAGLNWVKNIRLPVKLAARLRVPFVTKNMGNILCIVLVGLTLAVAIPVRQNIPYYHMIDDEDYQAFVWIKENVNGSYKKAILDPWKATAFTALTEKNIYTRITGYPIARDNEAYDFLHKGSQDTNFLKNNGISIVYTRWEVRNPDLVEVRRYVYLLKEANEPE